MSFFGKIGGFLKGAGKIASFIPGVGGLIGKGAGVLGDLMQGGAAVAGAKGIYDANKQIGADQKQARQYAQQSAGLFGQMAQGAQDRYQANSPLRDAFRFGVMNAADPTNPFSRGNMFDKFNSQLAEQMAGPQTPETRTAKPRDEQPQGGLAGFLNGGAAQMVGGHRDRLLDKVNANPSQNGLLNMFGGNGTLMQKMAGKAQGGRKTGTPVNRSASQKGSRPGSRQMSRAYDERDERRVR